MTSTFVRSLVISIVALGSVIVGACGDEEDPTFSNRAACEDFVTSYNALSCTTTTIDAGTTCGAYEDGATIDCSNILNCWADSLECVDMAGIEIPTYDLTNCPTECI